MNRIQEQDDAGVFGMRSEKMLLKAQRLEILKELGKEQEIVSWDRLQSRLQVSKATLWRDIEELEKKGIVRKIRGGVNFRPEFGEEIPKEARTERNPEAKKKIAEAALSFIDDDDFVMLDSGTTVLELARKIPPDKPVRVVTYYYEAAEKIAAGERSEVFLVGGKMRKGFYTCHGHMAEEMLKEFHAKTCFLGADGVDGKAGLTGYNSLDVPLKQIMIRQSERVVLLCDHTKFGQKAFVHVAPIEEIHTIITDSGTDPNVIQELREKNIEVIVT